MFEEYKIPSQIRIHNFESDVVSKHLSPLQIKCGSWNIKMTSRFESFCFGATHETKLLVLLLLCHEIPHVQYFVVTQTGKISQIC